VKAISHPAVHILGHPTGRLINVREPYDVDLDEVLLAAKEHHVAVELNANPERLDLSDVHVFRARELGVPVVISTDAHSPDNLRYMRYGVDQARRGWLEKKDVLNTKTLGQIRKWLARP
jgi:DNA polymerase (family X)